MFTKIRFIINPQAGKEEVSLSLINELFKDSGIQWDVSVTKKSGDAFTYTEKYKNDVDCIVAYGGDGTLMEIIQSLCNSNTPLAIIPGGTANVLSKEVGISQDTTEALKLLLQNNPQFKIIDTGIINGDRFFLRINFGILADTIKKTDTVSKGRFGQLAYLIGSIKHFFEKQIPSTRYNLNIDGNVIKTKGVSLVVNNAGNIGIEGKQLVQNIDISDGLLDVVVIRKANILSILSTMFSILFNTEKPTNIKHWQGKEIHIGYDKPQTIIKDDIEVKYDIVDIKIVPQSLKILVP